MALHSLLQQLYDQSQEQNNIQSTIGKLAKAFSVSSKDREVDEKAFFDDLLKTVASVPEGRKTLKELAATGCTFTIDPSSTSAGGYFAPGENKIVINTASGYKNFAATLVHEARHAIQHHNCPVQSCYLAAGDYLKYERLIEADATAHESAFLHQIRDSRPEIYQERSGLPMLQAYSRTFEQTHNDKQAIQASFAAWHTSVYYQDYYDKYHCDGICQFTDFGIKYKNTNMFSQHLSDDQIDKICTFDGKPYIDKAFLESQKAFSIPAKYKEKIEKSVNAYADSVPGATRDVSIQRLFTCTKRESTPPPPPPVVSRGQTQQKKAQNQSGKTQVSNILMNLYNNRSK